MSDGASPHRHIRSFVHRARRLSGRKQADYKKQFDQFGIAVPSGGFNPASHFPQTGPLTLEIGFGHAEVLLQEAQAFPERNFLGLEVYEPALARLLREIERLEFENLRVIRGDAAQLLPLFPSHCLNRLRILFPDPWPKRRHWKRRLLQKPFMRECARVLMTGGHLHMATDWEDYAEQIRSLLDGQPEWTLESALPERPQTHYEHRALRLKHSIYEWLAQRN